MDNVITVVMASRIVYHKSLPHNKISSCGISSQNTVYFRHKLTLPISEN